MPPLHKYLGNPVLSLDRPGALPRRRSATSTAACAASTAQSILDLDLQTTGHGVRERDGRQVHARRAARLRGADDARARTAAAGRRTCAAGATAGGTCASCCIFSPRWLFLIPGAVAFFLGLLGTLFIAFGPIVIGDVGFDVSSQVYLAALTVVGYQSVLFAILTKIYAQHEGFRIPRVAQLRPARATDQPRERRARRPGALPRRPRDRRSGSSPPGPAPASARSTRRAPCARPCSGGPAHDARRADDHGRHVPRRAQRGPQTGSLMPATARRGSPSRSAPTTARASSASSSTASSGRPSRSTRSCSSDDASGDGTVELAQRVIDERRATDAATTRARRAAQPRRARRDGELRAGALARHPATSSRCATRTTSGIPTGSARAIAEFAARPEVDLVAAEARLVDDAGAPLGATLFETLGVDAGVRDAARVGAVRGAAEAQRRRPAPR